ncbi:hypothetical protein CCMA1212_002731 [Trichoderma ghanense]|uniref:Uncharacterized protein n=1 Tax=Trichoderma ghanense TaxID=65468 RepID=A0ABY2HBQ3_9HYPO
MFGLAIVKTARMMTDDGDDDAQEHRNRPLPSPALSLPCLVRPQDAETPPVARRRFVVCFIGKAQRLPKPAGRAREDAGLDKSKHPRQPWGRKYGERLGTSDASGLMVQWIRER